MTEKLTCPECGCVCKKCLISVRCIETNYHVTTSTINDGDIKTSIHEIYENMPLLMGEWGSVDIEGVSGKEEIFLFLTLKKFLGYRAISRIQQQYSQGKYPNTFSRRDLKVFTPSTAIKHNNQCLKIHAWWFL
ncbi:UNVERIFIED_CONTAM: hypothetical protein NCL1_31671 [Trichonephila clavipes]